MKNKIRITVALPEEINQQIERDQVDPRPIGQKRPSKQDVINRILSEHYKNQKRL